MSLKKKSGQQVIIAGSLVMMCATADAADTVMGEKSYADSRDRCQAGN